MLHMAWPLKAGLLQMLRLVLLRCRLCAEDKQAIAGHVMKHVKCCDEWLRPCIASARQVRSMVVVADLTSIQVHVLLSPLVC